MTRWMTTMVGLALSTGAFAQDADADGWPVPRDCDDADPTAYPGAPELPNGVDDDCDGLVDEGGTGTTTTGTWTDQDGDGWSVAFGDCDDADPTVFPGAPELPDGIDNDCDGVVDEGGGTTTTRDDLDGDGFTAADGDCDDADPTVYPGAPEVENGVDDDCDGEVDEGFGTTTPQDSGTGGDGGGPGCLGTGGSYAWLVLLPFGWVVRRLRR